LIEDIYHKRSTKESTESFARYLRFSNLRLHAIPFYDLRKDDLQVRALIRVEVRVRVLIRIRARFGVRVRLHEIPFYNLRKRDLQVKIRVRVRV
jgi:hypothetical protein